MSLRELRAKPKNYVKQEEPDNSANKRKLDNFPPAHEKVLNQFIEDCIITFPKQTLHYKYPGRLHRFNKKSLNFIILCILLFPRAGRIYLANIFTDGRQELIRPILETIYSPSEYTLSNEESRVAFSIEVKDLIGIQYKGKPMTLEQMESRLRDTFFKEVYPTSYDARKFKVSKEKDEFGVLAALKALSEDLSPEECWDHITPKDPLNPMPHPTQTSESGFFASSSVHSTFISNIENSSVLDTVDQTKVLQQYHHP